VPDPAAVEGTEAEKRRAFREAYLVLENRIKLFTSLRLEALDRLAIKRNVDEIGRLRLVAAREPAP
jgi:arsenate reductase (thioredoxin)